MAYLDSISYHTRHTHTHNAVQCTIKIFVIFYVALVAAAAARPTTLYVRMFVQMNTKTQTSFFHKEVPFVTGFWISMLILIPDANYFRWTVCADVITAPSIAQCNVRHMQIAHAIFLIIFEFQTCFQFEENFNSK